MLRIAMLLTFEEKLIGISLMQAGCSASSASVQMNAYSGGQYTLEKMRDLFKSLEEAKKTHKAIGGVLIELQNPEATVEDRVFFLYSMDNRSVQVTKAFLNTCLPEWAIQLEKIMDSWDF